MLNESQIKSLENLKSYKKETVILGLYSYQIVATVDYGNNRIMYKVGNHEGAKLTDKLEKAIEMIKEMVENDPNCR